MTHLRESSGWFGVLSILIGGLMAVSLVGPAAGMPENALVALKQAGLGDDVIAAVAREKVIETAAFTVGELVALKKAGMTDETIAILVTERSFMRQAQPVVYGRALKPLKLASVEDLIELKRAGLSDDVIEAVVRVSSGRRGGDTDRAWEMLNQFGIEVDVHP